MKLSRFVTILAMSSILLSGCSSWELDHCPSFVESDGTLDLPQMLASMEGYLPTALRGPVYQNPRPRASQQAMDDDKRQRTACNEFRSMRPGRQRDDAQNAFVNAQMSVYAEGLKGNLKPGETAAAAILQGAPAAATGRSGWYGFILSANIDRDEDLKAKVGNFSRLPGNGTFSQLCTSVGLVCDKVMDWEGKSQSCHENPNDGTRLAYCQGRS